MQKPTIFQRLSNVFGSAVTAKPEINTNTYGINNSDILFRTKNKEEYTAKTLELKQQHLLAKQWKRAQFDLTNRSLAGLNEIKMMYRDADLMDTFPEIGAALDIVAEEATFIKSNGFMVNITSKSERIKSILQDLLVNRLSIHTTLPMICRAMCKYGNNFMLLNIDNNNGIMGWKQLPVYEIERYEHGMENPYASAFANPNTIDVDKPDTTKFVWVGQSEYVPYMNWQIAHFRLLYDSLFLPYGCSFLHKARRHFRMLSMMEDMLLIYRMERSIERRVFKINVGAIDEADVPAYVEQVANNFKRTPIVDPMTGQLDLRKNLLNTSEDYFVPVRDDSAPNPIDTLTAAQNLTAMDDIKFIQNKVMTALRVPKSFLNFEEEQGDGKNLSLLDIRFTRTVNRIQQALLMELNKVCIIHLYLLGFKDELTNFSLTMNNPSSQAEMLELENIAKKITTAKDAITDGGNGIPVMSVTRAWKEIMGWSDKEIEQNLEELRLEKALVTELENTSQIIKRTRLFDPVDNIYGEPGAQYVEGENGGEGNDGPGAPGGGGGFGGGGFDFGGDMGDAPDMDAGAEDVGTSAPMDMDMAAQEDDAMGGAPEPMDNSIGEHSSVREKKPLLVEDDSTNVYIKMLEKSNKLNENKQNDYESISLTDKNFIINEELDAVAKQLEILTNK